MPMAFCGRNPPFWDNIYNRWFGDCPWNLPWTISLYRWVSLLKSSKIIRESSKAPKSQKNTLIWFRSNSYEIYVSSSRLPRIPTSNIYVKTIGKPSCPSRPRAASQRPAAGVAGSAADVAARWVSAAPAATPAMRCEDMGIGWVNIYATSWDIKCQWYHMYIYMIIYDI